MRITAGVEARLYMEMLRISNAQKVKRSVAYKSSDTITLSGAAKKMSQVSKNNRTSSNRRIDESIDLQSYINKAKEKNAETIKNAGDKITSRNSYVSETDVCYEALHDKYNKLLEVAKSHSNPEAYIQDKYCNENSPYYASDLTDEEREAAYDNEINMLKYGKINGCNMRDSLFRGITFPNANEEDEDQKTFNRQVANSEMDNLFKENRIEVPEGTELSFSIDPYSYNLTVSGTQDKGLKEKIEELLNSGDNSKELYNHILSSSQYGIAKSTQFTLDGFRKYDLYHEALDVTGIDIRSLTEKDGSYYTKDGQNITDIFNSKLEEMAKSAKPYVPKQYTGVCEETFASMIQEMSYKGWNNIPDMMLSINYSDNKLQDVCQNTNYSESYNKDTSYKYGKNSFNTLP